MATLNNGGTEKVAVEPMSDSSGTVTVVVDTNVKLANVGGIADVVYKFTSIG